MKAKREIAPPSINPKCADRLFGYGIGICAGCNRFPVVIYKAPRAETWRCEPCFAKDYGKPPANLVKI